MHYKIPTKYHKLLADAAIISFITVNSNVAIIASSYRHRFIIFRVSPQQPICATEDE